MKMIKAIQLLLIGLFLPSLLCAQTWREVNGLDDTDFFKELEFLNVETGMGINNTSNVWLKEGSMPNWLNRSYITNNELNALEPSPVGEFLLVGDGGTAALGQVNGNNVNWLDVQIPSGSNLNNSTYLDQDNAWIVGDSSTLLFSSDGASSFSVVNIVGLNANYRDIAIQDENGVIVTSGNTIGISKDGGKNWSAGATLPSSDYDQVEYGGGSFWAFSSQNNSLASSVNGDTWAAAAMPGGVFNGFEIRGGLLYLVGDEGNSFTSSGGTGWVAITGVPDSIDLQSVSCVDNGCFTAGTEGKVYFFCDRVTVGGTIWGETTNNCTLDNSENGFPNISVSLLTSTGTVIANTTSDSDGNYEFDVAPGSYSIRVNTPISGANSPFDELILCGTPTDANNDIDNDQNGIIENGLIVSNGTIDLACGTEPGAFGVVNKTVDFGLALDCFPTNNPFANSTCSGAAPVCEFTLLEQGCGTMFVDNSVGQPDPLCNGAGSPQNMQWIGFVAGLNPGNYEFIISTNGCLPGGESTSNTGIQVGIYKDCSFTESVYCNTACNSKSITVSTENLIPGNQYWLWIDGCGGSVCSYNISFAGQIADFKLTDPVSLLCDGEAGNCESICPGTEIEFEVLDDSNASNNQSLYPQLQLELPDFGFNWTITDPFGTEVLNEKTSTNKISYTFDEFGIYEVCMDDIDYQCKNLSITSICKNIEVILIEDENFGIVTLCEGEIFTYPGPTSVNDEGLITDPNGDGTDGWQDPNTFFIEGPNFATITTPQGCVYDQEVEINIINDATPVNIDIVVCDESEFPLVVMERIYSSEVLNQLVTIPGGAASGCDSSAVINIYEINYEGSIAPNGCDSNGVQLVFTPSQAQNSQNFPVTGVWTDGLGIQIPDDGDNNPFTATVPFGSDNYQLSLIVDANGIRSCSYDFSYTQSFSLPSINGPDTVCVDAAAPFVFSFPGGINSTTPLFNLDGGTFAGTFTLDQPIDITWDTPGLKEITLAYQENGCYVENKQTVFVGSKFEAASFLCLPDQDEITITWAGIPQSEITQIEVLTGQTGMRVGNIFTISNLTPGDAVSVEFNVESDICGAYSVIVLCSTSMCDSIPNLPIYTNCDDANENSLCDINMITSGCETLLNPSTDAPNVSCLVGDQFNTVWIPFTAGAGDYAINTIFNNCEQGNVADGMQYALFKGCDLVNPVLCSDQCSTDTLTIGSAILDPGQEYTLFLNGCNGTICDYNFLIEGQFTPYVLPTISGISVDGSADDTISYCGQNNIVVDLIINDSLVQDVYSGDIHWSINDGDTTIQIVTTTTELTLSNYTPGTYEVCFDDITHNCSDVMYTSFCKTIVINEGGNPPVIVCTATISTIDFSWSTDSTHAYYIITDASGQMDTVMVNNYTVSGLNPGDFYDLVLTTVYNNGCPNTTSVLSCQTLNCPPVTIMLDAGGQQTICLQDSVNTVDIMVTVTPTSSGVGVFSGPGIIDAAEGIFDASVAGVGVHQIIYTYTDQSCVYEASIQMTVIGSISASFTISDDTICLEDQVMFEFTGMASNSTAFVWTFGGATVLSGMGSGPYTLAYDTTGVFTIDLALEDTICGSASVSGNILVQDCTPMPNSCICPDLIDTTIVCPAIFDPVCGCDGVTYSNACEAQFFGGVMSWTAGPCNNTNMDTISAFCDDGNPMTQNDSINENCECVGEIINDVNDLINQITFFPNPTDGIIYAEGIRDEDITVVNTLGQLLKRTRMEGNKIDITDLPTGIYLIKVGALGVKRIYKK